MQFPGSEQPNLKDVKDGSTDPWPCAGCHAPHALAPLLLLVLMASTLLWATPPSTSPLPLTPRPPAPSHKANVTFSLYNPISLSCAPIHSFSTRHSFRYTCHSLQVYRYYIPLSFKTRSSPINCNIREHLVLASLSFIQTSTRHSCRNSPSQHPHSSL